MEIWVDALSENLPQLKWGLLSATKHSNVEYEMDTLPQYHNYSSVGNTKRKYHNHSSFAFYSGGVCVYSNVRVSKPKFAIITSDSSNPIEMLCSFVALYLPNMPQVSNWDRNLHNFEMPMYVQILMYYLCIVHSTKWNQLVHWIFVVNRISREFSARKCLRNGSFI